MALYLLKPVIWNDEGYRRPAGARVAAESYPGQTGFGHEEWNNSDKLEFSEGGKRYRAFHTEGIKKAPVHEHEGQTFVFMIASHHGVQQLVGVAANAVYLSEERHEAERERIAKLLKLENRWRDVWALEKVRKHFNDDAERFQRHLNQHVRWLPRWVCLAEDFLWLDKPVTLQAESITGSASLPMMFNTYKRLELGAAVKVMNSVPAKLQSKTWARVLDAMKSGPEEPVPLLESERAAKVTTRLSMTLARVGQGGFRQDLMSKWDRRCSVTGLDCPELLRASHVKPWTVASSDERLDPNNGLLLAAHLDALFDKGLISFDDAGKMLVTSRLPTVERQHFDLPLALRRRPGAALRGYLSYHRTHVFDRTARSGSS